MTHLGLRDLIESRPIVVAPGVWDGLSARFAAEAGFEALYTSGASIAASMGQPDVELYSMTENAEAVRRVTAVTDRPVIADMDTGYGGVVNVIRSVREFERAGAAAVTLEDQRSPKRCPDSTDRPVEIISLSEAIGKLRAALDARSNPSFLIIARSDARAPEAVDRLAAYAAEGADLVMVISQSFGSREEWARSRASIGKPFLADIGADTWQERDLPLDELQRLNVKVAVFALQALHTVAATLRAFYTGLRSTGHGLDVPVERLLTTDFDRFIGYPEYDELVAKYGTALGSVDPVPS